MPRARDYYVSQANIEPVQYHFDDSQFMGKHTEDTQHQPNKLTEQVGLYNLNRRGSLNTPPGNKPTPMLALLPISPIYPHVTNP